jgi:hypothetical protein
MNNIIYNFDENDYSKKSHETATLNQGIQFKKYQKKIKNSVNPSLKEGFVSASNSSDSTSSHYNLLLQEVKELEKNYMNYSKDLVDVADPNNIYHNKNVRFTNTGHIGYVTNMGNLKLYPDDETFENTAGKNGCGTTTLTEISGDFGTLDYGKIIKANPPLLVGNPMINGQSCGNEGNNVNVKTILPTSMESPTYLGCYANVSGSNAMSFIGDYPTDQKNGSYTYDECKAGAISGGYRYFGLQNIDPDDIGRGYCAVTNKPIDDLTYGTILWSSETAGQTGCSATLTNQGSLSVVQNNLSIYSTPVQNETTSGLYFLILQDDANLCIYSGTGPNDNRGLVWQSKTNGSQGGPNIMSSASNGKYGKNYIVVGSALSAGDFLGSDDGSSYLLMQTDGNLVLYKSATSSNCSTMEDSNMGGGFETSAIYDIGVAGFPETLGKVGYIDYDSNLFEYESPTNLVPPGDSLKNTDIDSLQWSQYTNSGKYVKSDTFNSYGMFNTQERNKIDEIKSELNTIASQIGEKTNNFISKNANISNKITDNNLKFIDSQDKLRSISRMNNSAHVNNIDGILKDSDIVVLHENYKYILWSILAVVVVSISLNLLKK